MPSVDDLLEDGLRFERSGALKRALESYAAALEGAVGPAETARALRHQADAYRTQCEWDNGLEAARSSAAISREAGLPTLLGEALNAEAAIHLSRGHLEEARPLYEEMLTAAPDDRIRGIALQNLGSIAARSGDLEVAESRFRQSYECFKRIDYPRGEAIALNNSAAVALDRKNYERAASIGEEAIAAARRLEDLELVAIANLNYAESLAYLQRFVEAEELASAALGFFQVTPNRWRQVRCLRLLGHMNLQRGDEETARRMYESGLRLAVEIEAQSEAAEMQARLDYLRDKLTSAPGADFSPPQS